MSRPAGEARRASEVGVYHNEILEHYYETIAGAKTFDESRFREDFARAVVAVLEVERSVVDPFLDMTLDESGQLVIWQRERSGLDPAEVRWMEGFFRHLDRPLGSKDAKAAALAYVEVAGPPFSDNLEHLWSTALYSSDYWAGRCQDKDGDGVIVVASDAWGAVKGGLIGGWIGAIIGGAVQSIAMEAVVDLDDD